MDTTGFDSIMLLEKQERFKDVVARTAKHLSVSPPKIKFWEGYCPDSQSMEIAHIPLEERQICISNYFLKAMTFEDIDNTAVHETTHLVEASHNEKFQKKESIAEERLWYSRQGSKINRNNEEDVMKIALRKVKQGKSKNRKV